VYTPAVRVFRCFNPSKCQITLLHHKKHPKLCVHIARIDGFRHFKVSPFQSIPYVPLKTAGSYSCQFVFKQPLQCQFLPLVPLHFPSILNSYPIPFCIPCATTRLSTPHPNIHLRIPKRTKEQKLTDELDGLGRLLDEMPEKYGIKTIGKFFQLLLYLPHPVLIAVKNLTSLTFHCGFEIPTSPSKSFRPLDLVKSVPTECSFVR
jgi:hypothetical protein